MDTVFLLHQMVQSAHTWLEQTVGELTAEQVHWAPEHGLTIGAHYAHIVISEDVQINAIVKGGAAIAGASLEGGTGLSEPMPQGAFDEWAKSVQIDMPALRAYGAAVFANTEAYIATLTPRDLDREIDLTTWGMGMVPLGVFIGSFTIANTNCHCGEISALKGLQGLKGYPV